MQSAKATGQGKGSSVQAVRFPLPDSSRVAQGRWQRWRGRLLRRWRRVVIQGQHYWLPG